MALAIVLMANKNHLVKASSKNMIASGAGSGLMAGLFGTGGAIRGLALQSFGLKKEAFIATSALIDLGVDMGRSIVYTHNGYVHLHDLPLVGALIGISYAGTFAGKKLLVYVSEERFKQWVLGLVMVAGVLLFYDSIR